MDVNKFKIWQSGLTDEEREIIAKNESAEAVFKAEKDKVSHTVNTKGFKLILDKIVLDMECAKIKLLRCSEKDLHKIQTEIKIRREFLDKWTPYMD